MAVRRVAVTGAGVVSPLGADLAQFHRSLAAARSGIRRLAPELAGGSGVQVGATVAFDQDKKEPNLDRLPAGCAMSRAKPNASLRRAP